MLQQPVEEDAVLVVPLAADTIATVTIGPRSRAVAPSRFGRVVGWRTPGEPSYSLQVQEDRGDSVGIGFRRLGRFLRAERRVSAGSAPRLVAVEIEMASQRPFALAR